jgi:hypothetical protein
MDEARRRIGARLNPRTVEWYERKDAPWETPYAGHRYALEAFPVLYRQTLDALRGRFTREELCLILEAANGTLLTPEIAGQHLALGVGDAMSLDGLDAKHGVDRDVLRAKLRALAPFEAASLELWAAACWRDKRRDLASWLAPLLPAPLSAEERRLLAACAAGDGRYEPTRKDIAAAARLMTLGYLETKVEALDEHRRLSVFVLTDAGRRRAAEVAA